MPARGRAITPAARNVLTSSVRYDGPRVTITKELDDAVWRDVKAVLEIKDAVYVPRASAFEFASDQDAEAIVHDALAAGRVWRKANGVGFVPTPPLLAEELVILHANIPLIADRRLRVLEPSAGTGRLIEAVIERMGTVRIEVVAVEPDARRARQIEGGDHISVVVDTFEAYLERARAARERFDLIVMNPPFAVPGHATIWVDHLLGAWDLLAPGGRLMAILPPSVLDRDRGRRIRQAFDLVHLHGDSKLLEPDAFAESGITVGAAAVWLDRPLTEARTLSVEEERHPAFFRTYTGDEVPIPVTRPFLTRAAAQCMPVQSRDSWPGEGARILRYCADCVICTKPVWMFDDGENSPLGILRDRSGCWSFNPASYGYGPGPRVGICIACSSERAVEAAQRLWRDKAPAAQPGQLTLGL